MKKEYRPTQEFWEYLMKVNNDPKIKYEQIPADIFVNEAIKKYNIEIKEICRGPDPPDFILKVDQVGQVALEVTSLTDPQIRKHEAYYRKVEAIIGSIIQKYIHFLPKGNYMFYYYPGDYSQIGEGLIEVPNFAFRMNERVLTEKLDLIIDQWFSRFFKKKEKSMQIVDGEGNAVRINMMFKFESDDRKFTVYPQGQFKRITDNSNLRIELQKRIDQKFKKYKLKPWVKEYDELWLLIQIRIDEMDVSSPEIEFEKLIINSRIFHHIFVLKEGYPFTEVIQLTNRN